MARWLWNDHPDPSRLASQLDAMLDAGFGGALIRPGAGLPPGAYLSEAWFEAVAAVAKRARKRRGSIWIAEDFDDPETQSVVRGILRDAPDRAARMLAMDDVAPGLVPPARAAQDELVAAFEVTRESARPAREGSVRIPQSLRTLTAGTEEAAPVRRLLFRLTTCEDRLSLFDSDATLQLIERTHQRYHTQARKYFGNTIGMCLMLGACGPRVNGAVPWDPEAPAFFQETHGYSLIANLPALFFDLPGYEAVRFDFWTLLDEMIGEGFTQPFARWSDERGIPHASVLPNAADAPDAVPRGARAMARFAAHSFAAIESGADAVVLHEARSIKRQLGKEGVLEIPRGDQNGHGAPRAMERTVRGVNFMAERTVLASVRGARKCAAVAPILGLDDDNAPLRAELDAEARLSWMLGQGRASAEVLVLHPYASLRALYCAGQTAESSGVYAALVRHFAGVSRAIDDAGIDFDYADESVLARHGRAEHKIVRLGQAEYRVVVLPPLLNLRSTTLGLLHDFAISGGLVLAIGSLPELIDGRRSNQGPAFFEEYGERILQGPDVGRYQALVDRLIRAKTATAIVDADTGRAPECIVAARRTWDEIEMVALHNAGDRPARVTLDQAAAAGGRAELWDPLTATMQPLGALAPGQPIHQTIALAANAPALVVNVPDEMDLKSAAGSVTEEARVTPPWTARRTQVNSTALCECRLAEGGGHWTGPGELRQVLAERIAQAHGPVALRTQWRFRVAAGAPSIAECVAVAELSEGASMRLDSDELVTEHDKWILDPSMRAVALPPLAAGEHTLEIWRLYAAAGDLQAPWLRGPFADVTLKDECTRIAPARDTIAVGSLASQGLRSYFGEIVYAARMDGTPPAEGRRMELRLRGLSEPVEVRVDGSRAGFVLPPHANFDLTGFWRAGTRSVDILLRVPLDNLLAQLRDGRHAAQAHHGLPSPPEIVTLARR